MAPRRSLWPYLAHLPLVAWTFAGPLFFGLVPYFRDVGYYYYPNEVFLERSFAVAEDVRMLFPRLIHRTVTRVH